VTKLDLDFDVTPRDKFIILSVMLRNQAEEPLSAITVDLKLEGEVTCLSPRRRIRRLRLGERAELIYRLVPRVAAMEVTFQLIATFTRGIEREGASFTNEMALDFEPLNPYGDTFLSKLTQRGWSSDLRTMSIDTDPMDEPLTEVFRPFRDALMERGLRLGKPEKVSSSRVVSWGGGMSREDKQRRYFLKVEISRLPEGFTTRISMATTTDEFTVAFHAAVVDALVASGLMGGPDDALTEDDRLFLRQEDPITEVLDEILPSKGGEELVLGEDGTAMVVQKEARELAVEGATIGADDLTGGIIGEIPGIDRADEDEHDPLAGEDDPEESYEGDGPEDLPQEAIVAVKRPMKRIALPGAVQDMKEKVAGGSPVEKGSREEGGPGGSGKVSGGKGEPVWAEKDRKGTVAPIKGPTRKGPTRRHVSIDRSPITGGGAGPDGPVDGIEGPDEDEGELIDPSLIRRRRMAYLKSLAVVMIILSVVIVSAWYVLYVYDTPPTASFEAQALDTDLDNTIYAGHVVHFDATSSFDEDGNITSYRWDFGDGSEGNGSIIDHVFDDDGVYAVTLTVKDEAGTTDKVTRDLEVYIAGEVVLLEKLVGDRYQFVVEAATENRSTALDLENIDFMLQWDTYTVNGELRPSGDILDFKTLIEDPRSDLFVYERENGQGNTYLLGRSYTSTSGFSMKWDWDPSREGSEVPDVDEATSYFHPRFLESVENAVLMYEDRDGDTRVSRNDVITVFTGKDHSGDLTVVGHKNGELLLRSTLSGDNMAYPTLEPLNPGTVDTEALLETRLFGVPFLPQPRFIMTVDGTTTVGPEVGPFYTAEPILLDIRSSLAGHPDLGLVVRTITIGDQHLTQGFVTRSFNQPGNVTVTCTLVDSINLTRVVELTLIIIDPPVVTMAPPSDMLLRTVGINGTSVIDNVSIPVTSLVDLSFEGGAIPLDDLSANIVVSGGVEPVFDPDAFPQMLDTQGRGPFEEELSGSGSVTLNVTWFGLNSSIINMTDHMERSTAGGDMENMSEVTFSFYLFPTGTGTPMTYIDTDTGNVTLVDEGYRFHPDHLPSLTGIRLALVDLGGDGLSEGDLFVFYRNEFNAAPGTTMTLHVEHKPSAQRLFSLVTP